MIEVISAGLHTSIQDLGRFGFRHIGVPISGAMDQTSAQLANALLNNNPDAAVLEMCIIGATLKFTKDCYIAVTGAQSSIKNNSVIFVVENTIVDFGRIKNGNYIYMAIKRGINSKNILKSRSFYQGITPQSQLKVGDKINYQTIENNILNRSTIKNNSQLFQNNKIAVFKGPEFDLLDKKIQKSLFNQQFSISSKSNRMSIFLDHNISNITANEIITSSVQPGTIQLTPSGQLIVLMRDAQTTGGYARVLQLSDFAINQLSQVQIHQKIKFALINS